ncbi:MAG: hypothetical protein JOS17DRAFT_756822, partial [Linnemannia elongata]
MTLPPSHLATASDDPASPDSSSAEPSTNSPPFQTVAVEPVSTLPPLFASTRVLAIPEILYTIGLALETYRLRWNPDKRCMELVWISSNLLRAASVARLWRSVLTPILWTTIDSASMGNTRWIVPLSTLERMAPSIRCLSFLNNPYDHAENNQLLSTLNLIFTESRIRSLSISNCSFPLEVLLRNCPDTLQSLTISGARSGIGPHTRGLLIASTSLVELGLEFIRMHVTDLINVLANKKFLRTVNIRTRCIFEQRPLAHQELRDMLLEQIRDTLDGSLPVKFLTVASGLPDWFFQLFLPVMTNLHSIDISRTQGNNGTLVAELLVEHTNNLRTVKISSTSSDWMMSFLDRMPDTVTNLHVALGSWNEIIEGGILHRSNSLTHLTIDSGQARGALAKLRFIRIIVVQCSHLQELRYHNHCPGRVVQNVLFETDWTHKQLRILHIHGVGFGQVESFNHPVPPPWTGYSRRQAEFLCCGGSEDDLDFTAALAKNRSMASHRMILHSLRQCPELHTVVLTEAMYRRIV